ncbi:hypothetical protein RDV89_02560 [Nocardioides zeae]|uniref:Uncharacterized protein n=1 Tax=Nocardioides imazamoxiresistens TaxID=3231893 RepID=A0ABU3PRT6_9ACTN|nr:hypothetical protein [Nocardioides zeae]MDT9591933.1 hypothetical protein [Nocardioides zeae]
MPTRDATFALVAATSVVLALGGCNALADELSGGEDSARAAAAVEEALVAALPDAEGVDTRSNKSGFSQVLGVTVTWPAGSPLDAGTVRTGVTTLCESLRDHDSASLAFVQEPDGLVDLTASWPAAFPDGPDVLDNDGAGVTLYESDCEQVTGA